MLPPEVVGAVRAFAAEDEAWALFDRDEHSHILEAIRGAAESKIGH
jgi:hypothetical protein